MNLRKEIRKMIKEQPLDGRTIKSKHPLYQKTMDAAKNQVSRGQHYLENHDYDMAKMFFGDAIDIAKVAWYVNEENFKTAYNTARNMDTAARDRIPQEVWDLFPTNYPTK